LAFAVATKNRRYLSDVRSAEKDAFEPANSFALRFRLEVQDGPIPPGVRASYA